MRWIEAGLDRSRGLGRFIRGEGCGLPSEAHRKNLLFTASAAALFLVTVAGSGQQAQSPAPAPQQSPGQSAPSAAARPAPPRLPRFLVFLDAAHGGTDIGARLSAQLPEKDLVLALSVRLRSALNAHGIPVITSRESDIFLSAVNRSEMADHANASACIALHATASGNGVHLFTSSLTDIPMARFLPWDTAQGAYAAQSQRLSSEIDSAMTYADIPVTLGRTALATLDSLTCPAVAIEIAPLSTAKGVIPVSDSAYQNRIIATITAAIEQWQKDWRQQP